MTCRDLLNIEFREYTATFLFFSPIYSRNDLIFYARILETLAPPDLVANFGQDRPACVNPGVDEVTVWPFTEAPGSLQHVPEEAPVYESSNSGNVCEVGQRFNTAALSYVPNNEEEEEVMEIPQN